MKIRNVLVVEDDRILRNNIRELLEAEGYLAFAASSGAETLTILRAKPMDAILLDLTLPDTSGLDLIGRIRQHTTAPVIVVSGKDKLIDKVVGLEVGADDYLTKPFETEELLARLKASIRRSAHINEGAGDSAVRTQKIRFGSWVLDPARRQVYDESGKSADLTAKEFLLISALVRNPGHVMTRSQLLDNMGPDAIDVTDRAIDIRIVRIRRKIDSAADLIKTIRGVGYMLEGATEVVP